MTTSAILQIENVSHQFETKNGALEVLGGIDLQIEPGEMVGIVGESGSGKTTFLLVCGAMLRPKSGSVTINGQNVFELSSATRAKFRARNIGYAFQTLQLVPYLNINDNIRMANDVSTSTASQWLERLGIAERAMHKPEAISHGQRQRAALARALAHGPCLVVADEPTGNLDETNTSLVFDTLKAAAQNGAAVLVATHDSIVRQSADRCLHLESGELRKLKPVQT